MPINYSVARADYIEEQTRLFLARIQRAQGVLSRAVLDDFMASLEISGGRVSTSSKNYRLIAELDKLYEAFLRGEGVDMMADFVKRTEGLFSLNERYFSGASNVSKSAFERAAKTTKDLVYGGLGVNHTTGKLIKGGPLTTILNDFSPINEIKAQLFNAVANNLLTVEARQNVQVISTGDGKTKGSLEKHMDRTMDQPFEKFDRSTGKNLSIGLEMNFATYQGGIVPATRDFCRVRNNQVFSREEISKFGTSADAYGGYTNKGAGEFQGKCPKVGYNPFLNLGGCNCLHFLTWISDELAYHLRPELRPVEEVSQ